MEALQDEAAVLKQLNRLYIGSRKAYLQQFDSGQYAQIKRVLTDKQVTAHLHGEQTIGVFYCGQRSKFLSFDVDTQDWVTVNALITTLRTVGIPDEAVHTEFSGMKGFHVTVFFDRPLSISRLASLGRAVLAKLGEYALKIELRPESVQGRGIKLPFAIHRGSGQRSCFVDPFTLQPYDDQASYFLRIRPFSADTMEQVISDAIRVPLEREPPRPLEDVLDEARELFRDIKPPTVQNSLSDKAQRLLTDGMRDGETRHASQFYVILFLKQQGWTVEEVIEQTIEWALREKAAGRAESSEAHIRRDVTNDVRYAFKHDRNLYDTRPFNVIESDLAFAASFRRKSMKKVVWALIILSRIFADKEGRFYGASRMVEQMTGISRVMVMKNITELKDAGVLVQTKDSDYGKRRAAQYRLNGLAVVDTLDGTVIDASSYHDLFVQTYPFVQTYDGAEAVLS